MVDLTKRLSQLLKEAEVEHKVAVLNGKATDEDRTDWYAEFMATKLLDSNGKRVVIWGYY